MTMVNLDHKLTELEHHYAAASTREKRRAAPRLRELLAHADHARRVPTRRERDATAEIDPFDNMPI